MNKLTIPLVIFLIVLATYIARNGSKAANTEHRAPVPITITNKIDNESKQVIKKKYSNHKSLEEALIRSFAAEDDQEVIRALKDGANPNIIFNKRKFTMAMDQSLNCNPPILLALINAGADLSMRDTHNKSALDYAKRNGSSKCIDILIKAGAK